MIQVKRAYFSAATALFAFLSLSAHAESPQLEQAMGLYFESPSAQERLQDLVRDPSSILRAFVPNGIAFSQFQVISERYLSRMEFIGSPKSEFVRRILRDMGFPVSFPIVGELQAENMDCRANGYLPKGYRFTLKLDRSHALIAQDVTAVEFLFCQKHRPDNKVELHGKGQLKLTRQAGQGKAGEHPIKIASWQFWPFRHALESAIENGPDGSAALPIAPPNGSGGSAAQGL